MASVADNEKLERTGQSPFAFLKLYGPVVLVAFELCRPWPRPSLQLGNNDVSITLACH